MGLLDGPSRAHGGCGLSRPCHGCFVECGVGVGGNHHAWHPNCWPGLHNKRKCWWRKLRDWNNILDIYCRAWFVQYSHIRVHVGTYWAEDTYGGDTPLCAIFNVNPATPTTTVSCLTSTLDVGSMTTCTGTVSGSAFGPSSLTGDMVSWSDAGSVSFSSASCTLSGSSCSVTVTGTGAGSASVKVPFRGIQIINRAQAPSP